MKYYQLNESQVKMIQSKIDGQEDQFKSLLSLTKKGRVVLEDSLPFTSFFRCGRIFYYCI